MQELWKRRHWRSGLCACLEVGEREMTTTYALSIVAPCYNEADGLGAFVARMTAAASAVVGENYELILVDDGSRDRTWAVMSELAKAHPAIVAVRLSRNHGHQLAVTAGLSLVRGDKIMVIDADLQLSLIHI